MILYELRCDQGHGFEAWFRNADAYDTQAAAGEIACPHCGITRVSKAPMAPRIAKNRDRGDGEALRKVKEDALRQLADLRAAIERNCDYVGDRFAEEARKIHYGETDPRGIYGETTDEQAAELEEEGISFARIPWVRPTNS